MFNKQILLFFHLTCFVSIKQCRAKVKCGKFATGILWNHGDARKSIKQLNRVSIRVTVSFRVIIRLNAI